MAFDYNAYNKEYRKNNPEKAKEWQKRAYKKYKKNKKKQQMENFKDKLIEFISLTSLFFQKINHKKDISDTEKEFSNKYIRARLFCKRHIEAINEGEYYTIGEINKIKKEIKLILTN